jgi:phasin family protein
MAVKTETPSTGTEAATKSYEQTVVSLKDGIAKATASFEQTQAKVTESMDKVRKTAEEAFAFNQGNIEAFTRSGQIWSAGLQDLSRQFATTVQDSIEETLEQFRALTSAQSVKDVIGLQSSLVRTSAEKAVTATSRLTSASIKLTEEALAPITARVGLAAEKFTKTV